MGESKDKTNTNKILLGIIAVLVVGLVYLGVQVKSLRSEVAGLSSQSPASILTSPKTTSPLKSFSKQHRWDPFNDEWDPFAEFDRIQKEMNRMFKDSFGRGQSNFGVFGKHQPFDLDTDIKETKSHYIVRMDIPGMDKASINVETKNNLLLVSGERNELKEENNKNNFFRRERSFGYFSRTVPLPENADESAITAEYKKGVLTVKIAKKQNLKEKEEKSQKINVS